MIRLARFYRPALVAVGVVALLAAGALSASQFWVIHAAQPFVYNAIDEVPARDVAIVPGVGSARPGRPPRSLTPRLRAALGLYRAHKVTAILVSGVGRDGSATDEVVEMQRWLRLRGVPPEHILVDPRGLRTLDTMRRSLDLLRVRSAVVCTQASFINRAVFLARGIGIDAVGFVAPAPRLPVDALKMEAVKGALALAEIYILPMPPTSTDRDGVGDSRTLAASLAKTTPAPLLLADAGRTTYPPAALSFFTSAINAGITVSQLPTSP